MAITFRVDGGKELSKALKLLSTDLQDRISRQMTMAGAGVSRDAIKEAAPVDTGRLRENIIVKRLPKSERQMFLTQEYLVVVRRARRKYGNTKKNRKLGRVGQRYEMDGGAYYGKFLEFGTVKMGAAPFFKPAFDASSFRAARAVIDEGKKRIEPAALQAAMRAGTKRR